jgi:hypothetical protein
MGTKDHLVSPLSYNDFFSDVSFNKVVDVPDFSIPSTHSTHFLRKPLCLGAQIITSRSTVITISFLFFDL